VVAAIHAGDAAYRSFDNDSARTHYSRALAVDSTRYETLWKLARAYSDCAVAAPRDQMPALFAESERLARRCVALYPDSARSHLALAIALGRMADTLGKKRRLEVSREVKREADATLSIDPYSYEALHVLGRWHYEIAGVGWLERSMAKIYGGVPSGASMKEARSCFERAIALDPQSPINHYWLAETLIKLDDRAGARASLERCIELDEVLWNDASLKTRARDRLAEIDRKK
jgi:tetratricopeptide (TPR) repeat protein